MADPREVTASEVLARIVAQLDRSGIDGRTVQLVLQAFDQAGYEMREKGARDPVPLAEQTEIVRRQIGDTEDWLLEVDLGERGSLVCVESLFGGKPVRSAWTALPTAPA